MGRLFGAEGAKGVALTELTVDIAMKMGMAVVHLLRKKLNRDPKILIGKDTRNTSDVLETALCAGICSLGADVLLAGIVPASVAANFVHPYGCDAGIMISAPRHGAEVNSFRIFTAEGDYITEQMEEALETLVLDEPERLQPVVGNAVGIVTACETAAGDYAAYVCSRITERFHGLKIAIDCANGSTSYTAADVFTQLGAEVLVINDQPDGTNINDGCGAMHIDSLMEYVYQNSCDAGLAFDGDGTRCLAVDETGELIDGDQMLAIFADDCQKRGALNRDSVVVSIMSNLGLNHFAKEHDIRTVTANSGDRYLIEKMLDGDYNLGGEQSGNIVFLDESAVSDGQMNGARLLEILKRRGGTLSEMAGMMEKYPKVMVNVRIPQKKLENWKNDDVITSLIEQRKTELGDAGRIIVRESTTTPLIRVMIEGKDFARINEMVMEISDLIRERAGQ